MKTQENSRYLVELVYYAHIEEDKQKIEEEIKKDKDTVTRVLDHFQINYEIKFQHYDPTNYPILNRIGKLDKHGNDFSIYYNHSPFPKDWGTNRVLHTLNAYGVIPSTIEESLEIGGKNNE